MKLICQNLFSYTYTLYHLIYRLFGLPISYLLRDVESTPIDIVKLSVEIEIETEFIVLFKRKVKIGKFPLIFFLFLNKCNFKFIV